MLLLSLSPYRSFLLRRGYGFPAPPRATMPEHNEIVLLARRRRTAAGTEHWIRWAMRGTSVKLRPHHPLRGRTPWVIQRVACWPLSQPFRLEGVQITPLNYALGPTVQQLDAQDAGEIRRRGLLVGPMVEEVEFRREPATPEDMELHNLFHKLWSRSAFHDDYLKAEWWRFSELLEKRRVFKYPPLPTDGPPNAGLTGRKHS